MNKIVKNTIVASCIAIVNESWSSFASTIVASYTTQATKHEIMVNSEAHR
jgi:hypothetical protein